MQLVDLFALLRRGLLSSASALAFSCLAQTVSPVITTQPADTTVVLGGSFVVFVGWSGGGPAGYLWTKDGVRLTNEIDYAVIRSVSKASDAGVYSVTITNASGSVTAAAATVRLTTPPEVTAQPGFRTVAVGTDTVFSVGVTGTSPLSYQWSKDGSVVAGGTNATLTLRNVSVDDRGSYTVRIENAVGTATSSPAGLAVSAAPVFTALPADTSVYLGQTAVLSASVYSATPVRFQWLFGTTALVDATNDSLVIPVVSAAAVGTYSIVATNSAGSSSTYAVLSAKALPDPALRFGAPTVVQDNLFFPVHYTAHGTETNLSFSVRFDPSVYTVDAQISAATAAACGCDFTGVSSSFSMTGLAVGQVCQTVGEVFQPPPVSGPASVPTGSGTTIGGRSRKASLPTGAVVAQDRSRTAEGLLGVGITLPPGIVFYPGEDRIGTIAFTLVPGATNLYAGRLAFASQPLPLAFAPALASATDTNNIVLTSPVPPVVTRGGSPAVLDPQTGLFQQVVELANPGPDLFGDVFLVVGALGTDSRTNVIRHQNAHGYLTTGETYVNSGAIAPGETRRLTLEYYVPDYVTRPSPTLTPRGSALATFTPPTGTMLPVTTNRFIAAGFLVEFPTRTGYRYYVQYASEAAGFSGTGTSAVRTTLPPVSGTGSNVQWLDNGAPKTASRPTDGGRFYRVLETR